MGVEFDRTRLLAAMAKVKQSARDLEQKMGEDVSLKAGFDPAAREIVFRVFSADNEWFEGGRTVHEFETVMQRDGSVFRRTALPAGEGRR